MAVTGDVISYEEDTTTFTKETIGTTTFTNECAWRTFTRDTLGSGARWDDASGDGHASGAGPGAS